MKKKYFTKKILHSFIFLFMVFLTPYFVHAQEVHVDFQGNYKGKVINIVREEIQNLFGADYTIQTLQAEILNGPEDGEIVEMKNDFQPLEKGDIFYFNYSVQINGAESYVVTAVSRQGALLLLVGIFVAAVILFGRWQGVRSLIALAASFLGIIFVLIPGILNGWSPLIASSLVASVILFAAIFFTHGFNRESLVAYTGTISAVILTGIFALFAVSITKLSGFAAEEAIYLNFNTGGALNFTSLLLGAFIIGFLGVLDDIAVTQAAIVTELFDSNPEMKRSEVYRRAMRIGQEHVGALVNTLVLAYTGASLPLLLYVSYSTAGILTTINLEVFATEIVRIIVGSIGLILTVPLVTFLAVMYLKNQPKKGGTAKKHHHHHHAH